MKRVLLIIDMPDNFEIGKCETCRLARDKDGCKVLELLTDGACSSNCYCPLVPFQSR